MNIQELINDGWFNQVAAQYFMQIRSMVLKSSFACFSSRLWFLLDAERGAARSFWDPEGFFLALEGILRDLYSHSGGSKWFHGILRDSLALEGISWPCYGSWLGLKGILLGFWRIFWRLKGSLGISIAIHGDPNGFMGSWGISWLLKGSFGVGWDWKGSFWNSEGFFGSWRDPEGSL